MRALAWPCPRRPACSPPSRTAVPVHRAAPKLGQQGPPAPPQAPHGPPGKAAGRLSPALPEGACVPCVWSPRCLGWGKGFQHPRPPGARTTGLSNVLPAPARARGHRHRCSGCALHVGRDAGRLMPSPEPSQPWGGPKPEHPAATLPLPRRLHRPLPASAALPSALHHWLLPRYLWLISGCRLGPTTGAAGTTHPKGPPESVSVSPSPPTRQALGPWQGARQGTAIHEPVASGLHPGPNLLPAHHPEGILAA